MKAPNPILTVMLVALCLAACGAPPPMVEPTLEPTPKPTAEPTLRPAAQPTPTPSLSVNLTTDSDYYKASRVEIQVTLTNTGDEPVYLPICGPWWIERAGSDYPFWILECEIDYLGHKIDPGGSFSGSVQLHLDRGSYRVRTEVYGDCTLGEPRTFSAQETYYGEFRECATREEIASNFFGAE